MSLLTLELVQTHDTERGWLEGRAVHIVVLLTLNLVHGRDLKGG